MVDHAGGVRKIYLLKGTRQTASGSADDLEEGRRPLKEKSGEREGFTGRVRKE